MSGDIGGGEVGVEMCTQILLGATHEARRPNRIHRVRRFRRKRQAIAPIRNQRGGQQAVDFRADARFAQLLDAGFTREEVKTVKVMHGKGCQICSGTGYKGRVALYEVMTITDRIRDLILQGASTGDIKTAAMENGMFSLRRSGLEKVKLGQTTIEEVIRVTFAD